MGAWAQGPGYTFHAHVDSRQGLSHKRATGTCFHSAQKGTEKRRRAARGARQPPMIYRLRHERFNPCPAEEAATFSIARIGESACIRPSARWGNVAACRIPSRQARIADSRQRNERFKQVEQTSRPLSVLIRFVISSPAHQSYFQKRVANTILHTL